jgi:tRNA pseudouridine38-40 synthase
MNYQIIIEYLGQSFVGWQKQKNGISVQAVVEKALHKTFKSKVKLIGSGRTDSGVNAMQQSANFYLKKKIKDNYPILQSINFYLKKYDVTILKIQRRNQKFHARHSAKKRQYEYIILNRVAEPSIDLNRVWFIQKKLDIKKMQKAVAYFKGTHDFSALRSSSCNAKSPVKTVYAANLRKKGDKIFINFISKSFLQKQVRSMVGCIKYVGESKWRPEKIKKIIKSKRRDECAPPAPPEGLFLKKVFY